MDLSTLNESWRETGKVHAVADDENHYHWFCPRCKQVGQTRQPLMGAMNSAIVHKYKCPELG